jgi:hypothetical protein
MKKKRLFYRENAKNAMIIKNKKRIFINTRPTVFPSRFRGQAFCLEVIPVTKANPARQP